MGLEAIELVLAAETHFGVTVPNEQIALATTVEALANVLFELQTRMPDPLPYETVLLDVRQLIARQRHLPVEQINPEMRFVEDLGFG